jgi:fatty acid desaturase
MDNAAPRRLPNIDYDGFGKAIFELKKEAVDGLCEADYQHLRKIIWWNRLCTFFGYATAWILPNPISAYLISHGITGRWLIMHHVGHGGYDQVPGVPERLTSKKFALGWRRFVDWFDWIDTSAWNYEHNVLHHLNTSEHIDPDLVEDLTDFLRRNRMPMLFKYIIVMIAGISWKYTYYAPNTLVAQELEGTRGQTSSLLSAAWNNAFNPASARVRRLWLCCYLPYALAAFVIIPLCFFPLGMKAVVFVLINRLLAECIANFQAFLVIAPNHSGDDIYRFNYHWGNKGEWCVNQVVSSCNFNCGTPALDYSQIWLNYQIEHHLFPRLPMTKYREIQPKVKAICEEFNVPYVQESVWRRWWKMVTICVGRASMPWLWDVESGQAMPPALLEYMEHGNATGPSNRLEKDTQAPVAATPEQA